MQPTPLLSPNLQKIYLAFFDTPIDQVTLVDGGGTSWQGHDVWLKLRSPRPLCPKDAEQYEQCDPSPAEDYFDALLPDNGEIHEDSVQLRCLCWADSATSYAFGRWFLVNEVAGISYFRSWKHS